MEKENIIELFYQDYYLQTVDKSIGFKSIKFDKQVFYIFSKINDIVHFNNIDCFIQHYLNKFNEEKIPLGSIDKLDNLEIEKTIVNSTYPFIANIDRLKILQKSLTEKLAIKIFGISFSDIYDITGIIILRTLLYNDYLCNKKMTSNERINFFDTIKPNCFFTAEELQKLNNRIELYKIEKYLNFFSIELSEISKEDETKKILKINNKYVVMFMQEFCTFLFNYCEECIIEYLKNNCKKQLDQYYKQRGDSFEKYVKDILKKIFPSIMSNVKYLDNNARNMELDNFIIEEDICFNFECKSAGFNVYNSTTYDKTIKQLLRAFGRGYYSIDTFHKTIKNNNGNMIFKINNQKNKYNLSNKKIISFNVTMYPIEFLSTSIHFFDENYRRDITVFPITINIMDLYCIILISTMNKKIFNNYSIERFYSINNMGKLKIDYDELDAFGYILDYNLKNGYNTLKRLTNVDNNIEHHIMITNSAYRDDINHIMACYGFNLLADTVLCEDKLKILEKMILKRQ